MRPEGYGHDASSWLGLARQMDEFDVSAMNSVEVADHYNSRPTHPSDPPGLPLWRPQTVKQRADRGRVIQNNTTTPKGHSDKGELWKTAPARAGIDSRGDSEASYYACA